MAAGKTLRETAGEHGLIAVRSIHRKHTLKTLLHRSPRVSRAKSGMFAGLFQVTWATKEKPQREDSDSVRQA